MSLIENLNVSTVSNLGSTEVSTVGKNHSSDYLSDLLVIIGRDEDDYHYGENEVLNACHYIFNCAQRYGTDQVSIWID